MAHLEKLGQAAGARQSERSVVVRCCLVSRNQTRCGHEIEGGPDDCLRQTPPPKIGLGEDAADFPDLFVILKDETGAGELAIAFDPEPLRAVFEILGQFIIVVAVGVEHGPGAVVGTGELSWGFGEYVLALSY